MVILDKLIQLIDKVIVILNKLMAMLRQNYGKVMVILDK
jgi:hypothetical protein